MNVTRIILNRLLFRILPLVALLIFTVYYEKITFDNLFEKLGFLHLVLLAGLVYFCYDLIKHFRKAILRNRILKQAQLEDIPADMDLPKRLNFLDKRLSISDMSIDVFLKNNVILHLSKSKKQIEIRNFFGKKILSFHEIKYIFLEYNQYEKDTFKDIFVDNSYYDKNVWNNSIRAMLKNGNPITLFEVKLEETNYEKIVDEQISGKYEQKSYLDNGGKIILLFSKYMGKKYLIINNTI